MQIEAELDCGICRLRPLRTSDIPALARHANNLKVAEHLRERFPSPYSIEDGYHFLEQAQCTHESCVAGIVVDDEVVGVISIQLHSDIDRCSGELGYWLGEAFWGRGIVTAAIISFTSWAMPRFSLTRVYANVFAENPASARVLEKAGFEYVGLLRKAAVKHGVHHDYRLYDMVR
jgi:ribosomal-protein-alanine N-acetyltransferase